LDSLRKHMLSGAAGAAEDEQIGHDGMILFARAETLSPAFGAK